MRINVTLNHIRRGTRQDSDNCMLAQAISEALEEHVFVGSRTWGVQGADYLGGSLPEVAYQARRDFDAGIEVKPFSFDLNLEEKTEVAAEEVAVEEPVLVGV